MIVSYVGAGKDAVCFLGAGLEALLCQDKVYLVLNLLTGAVPGSRKRLVVGALSNVR